MQRVTKSFLLEKPSAPRVLGPTVARFIGRDDDSDDPPVSSLLEWHRLAPRGNLARKLAMKTQDSIPLSARALQRPGLSAKTAKAFVEAIKACAAAKRGEKSKGAKH